MEQKVRPKARGHKVSSQRLSDDVVAGCAWTAPRWKCPGQAVPGKKLCQDHLSYHREYMRQYRAKFRENAREANQRGRKCQDCEKVKGPDEFYRPRVKKWMAYKEFVWHICKACMSDRIKRGIQVSKLKAMEAA